jgi:hypothetical protein
MRQQYVFSILTAILLCGCSSSPKTWGNGTYRDLAQDQSRPYSYKDTLTEFDEEKFFSAAIAQLEACQNLPKRSVLLLNGIQNFTSTDFDGERLTAELDSRLSAKGFVVILKSARPDIISETTEGYESLGYTRQDQKTVKGRQEAANYLLKGSLSAKAQNSDDIKTVLYRFDLNVIDMERAIAVPGCQPSVQFKKVYERTRVSF